MFSPSAPLAAMVSLALPTECAVCRVPGPGLCDTCLHGVREGLWGSGPRRCRPDPEPAGMPPVHACGPFVGPLATVVTAYKDRDRRDLAAVLGPLLSRSVDAALGDHPVARRVLAAGDGPALLVPVPSSRASVRRRGDSPLGALGREAARGFDPSEVVPSQVLRVRRRVADQAGLGAAGRHTNVEHSMGVRPAWTGQLDRAVCVLVDDVLTTGATLREAARALEAGGARVVLAATICATQRRTRTPSRSPGSSRWTSR